MKIGGRAYRNGVRLFGEKYTVKCYYEDNQLKHTIGKNRLKENKLFTKAKQIPVLRGIISILFSLYFMIKEAWQQPKKFWPLLLIIGISIGLEIYWYLVPAGGYIFFSLPPLIEILVYIIGLSSLIQLLRKTLLKEIFKFHGAEHKAVNYYQNNFQSTIANQSRLAKRCGTNLVVFYLLIIISLELVGITFNVYLESLLALGLGYELLLAAPDYLMELPYLIQRITTIEPDDKHLKAAQSALEILIDLENNNDIEIIA
ncbi:MAG: DUF1385 domain-containing protein [Bacillota bacterium]